MELNCGDTQYPAAFWGDSCQPYLEGVAICFDYNVAINGEPTTLNVSIPIWAVGLWTFPRQISVLSDPTRLSSFDPVNLPVSLGPLACGDSIS